MNTVILIILTFIKAMEEPDKNLFQLNTFRTGNIKDGNSRKSMRY